MSFGEADDASEDADDGNIEHENEHEGEDDSNEDHEDCSPKPEQSRLKAASDRQIRP